MPMVLMQDFVKRKYCRTCKMKQCCSCIYFVLSLLFQVISSSRIEDWLPSFVYTIGDNARYNKCANLAAASSVLLSVNNKYFKDAVEKSSCYIFSLSAIFTSGKQPTTVDLPLLCPQIGLM